ncbi:MULTISPECIES: hypothetical protein [unclassified Desulfovibrio]|uniref:hypothetical protein n=1 Tax=unclassified Desulfovibrio TaxID=2593640 RepID=UPI000F5E99BE|nr:MULTISPECIES: hypothetical protein [unclassified Desulfovibrio]RRD72394.1 hypothetical protein EII24_00575 [Desulfovibrio sp. OH1209_COT-279]RRD88505.1 hypothetical protein EII23_00575 [Desulfovibrio sp. OH1186_COT-070]
MPERCLIGKRRLTAWLHWQSAIATAIGIDGTQDAGRARQQGGCKPRLALHIFSAWFVCPRSAAAEKSQLSAASSFSATVEE